MDPYDQLNLSFSSDFAPDFSAAEIDHFTAPQPLECLQGSPIPPFLSKTYDLVDDPLLDPIISWGKRGESFVVWHPLDFSRTVLPVNFKHSNFSSFVRQLNTYGFRKIDSDKWEFANEFFLRGSKHLLKKIQRRRRRRSPQPQQVRSEESELERLRMEKSVIMQEVAELQEEHRGTAEHVESIKRRLQDSEQRQKQMVSFIAKAVEKPGFIESLMQMKARRKIAQGTGCGLTTPMDEHLDNAASSDMLTPLPQHLVAPQELMDIPNGEFSGPQLGYLVDFPRELGADNAFSGLLASATEDLGFDFDTGSMVARYDFPITGHSGGLPDAWDLSVIQGEGSSGMGNWHQDDSQVGSMWYCGSKHY